MLANIPPARDENDGAFGGVPTKNVTKAQQTLSTPLGDPACGGFAPFRCVATPLCKTSTTYEIPNKRVCTLPPNRGLSYSAQDDTRG